MALFPTNGRIGTTARPMVKTRAIMWGHPQLSLAVLADALFNYVMWRSCPSMKKPPSEAALLWFIVARDQAVFCRRRSQPSNPPQARIRPGRPAPTTGPGTAAADCPLYTLIPGGGTAN